LPKLQLQLLSTNALQPLPSPLPSNNCRHHQRRCPHHSHHLCHCPCLHR
jgi:hypothetical protein